MRIAGAALTLLAVVVAAPVASGAPSDPPAVQAVNPARTPVVATATTTTAGAVRLRVRLPRGTTVALTPATAARAGTVRIRWNGRRGVGARGPAVRSGRYVLQIETAAGKPLSTDPEAVVVYAVAPQVTVRPEEPTLPAAADPGVITTVRGGTAGVEVRAIVRTLAGRTLGAGPWRPAARVVPIPERVLESGRAGAVRVIVQARDAAGNRSAAAPVAISLPGTPGAPRVMTRVTTNTRMVALTVDDGYQADSVLSMVNTAARMKATVTFCLNGSAARGYGASLRARLHEVAAAGYVQACSHGYSHNTGAGTSQGAAHQDLSSSVVWDRAVGQSTVPFYRPPYGAYGPGILAAARGLGYRNVLLWDVDTNDWRGRTAAQTTAHVLSHARAGSIVLMHAIPSSAQALPDIIAGLRARGLQPVGIGDLIAAGRPTR